MLELLSPAGSFDALRAAVCNGADAVYLGLEGFNARQGARNFTVEELPEAVRFCHIRGVKVHLTLNTLVSDRELPAAAKAIAVAAKAGVDAFIVQDLGMLTLCHQVAPGIALHASTQMSIHSLAGVQEAAALGVSRVVLARELPREELAHICRNTNIEIEVFVHGALCMCYSGQCYMSALIGRRSGNRGQCAQPCRLPYGYDFFEEKYPLSLKDNCLVQYLKELEQLGVASIKIEGRRKRPEYVAAVTGVYRAALDGGSIGPQAMKTLRDAFSREGFTQGYYLGQTGADMFGRRIAASENRDLMLAARASYENVEAQRVPVQFYALISRGTPSMLAAQDRDGNTCKAEGAVPEEARTKELTIADLEERLAKTGGTPFYCEGVKCVVDRGLSLSAAEINRLRREVLAQLSAMRGRIPPCEVGVPTEPQRFDGSRAAPVLTVSVLRTEQITPALLKAKPAVLYVPLSELTAQSKFYERLAARCKLAAILPRVSWGSEEGKLASALDAAARLGVRRVLTGNLGQIALLREKGFEIAGDFGLNILNSRTMNTMRQLGLTTVTASFEAMLPQLRDLSKPLPTEMLIYGRLPLMLTENCLLKNRAGDCACANGPAKLIDRTGEEFRIVRDCGTCRSVILNGRKLFLLDKKSELRKLGMWGLRLSFTTENPAEIDSVIAAWSGEAVFDPGACTRGLYLRGVE